MQFPVLQSASLVPNIHLLTIQAPDVARAVAPGQFVILRAEEDGERIPLTVADWDAEKGTISIVFMLVGKTTHKLASLQAGSSLPTVVGPLGNPLSLPTQSSVLLIGGCYGIGSIYPTARALKARDNQVFIAVEARTARLFYWEEKLSRVADRLFYITRDGTRGTRGHVASNLPRILDEIAKPVDQIILNGCNFQMMQGAEASRPFGIKTWVSLNTLMIDGTGMCGVCRVTVGGQRKFACVDGPYFDGHEVNWEELSQRRQTYLREEMLTLRSSGAESRRS